jgi:hypothetical protein
MPPYPVLCYRLGCRCPAIYKVAARWSDGVTEELKTYSLCCAKCLPKLFHQAQARRAACRLAPGETIDQPGIFEVHRGARDRHLTRLPELEQTLLRSSM